MISAIIAAIIICAIVGTGAYVYWLHRSAQNYTRDRFAFAGLATLSALALALIHTVAGPTPWEVALAGLKWLGTGRFEPSHATNEGRMLALLSIIVVGYVIIKVHESWPGQVTEDQWKAIQLKQKPNLVLDGVAELKRLITHADTPKLHRQTKTRDFAKITSFNAGTQFNVFAKELFCETNPDVTFDKDDAISWHERGSLWLGSDRRMGSSIVLFCTGASYSQRDTQLSLSYLRELPMLDLSRTKFFQVRRKNTDYIISEVAGRDVTSRTIEDILGQLMNTENYRIENYKEHIYKRINQDRLPNSEVTIASTFTESQVIVEQHGSTPIPFSAFVRTWLSDGRTSHVALLGEYGQGKSTSVLKLVYDILQKELECARLPILIELRGKSPKNQTPLEMLGAWGGNYGISGSALYALLRAGKLLIIFDGFDEMDGLDDERLRYENFAALWKFASFDDSKILITGRPELFLDDVELRRDLAIHPDIASGPFTQIAKLQRFTERQIGEALRNLTAQTRAEILHLARDNGSFRDIVSRPSLIQPVAAIWRDPVFAQNREKMNSALVISLFLESTYRRQSDKMRAELSHKFMRLNQSELAFFTQGIAVYMATKKLSFQITSAELFSAVQTIWQALGDSIAFPARPDLDEDPAPIKARLKDVPDPVESVATHIRSYGVIVRDYARGDTFKFSHKSYLELLVGTVAAGIIMDSRSDEHVLIMTSLSPSVSDLLISPVAASFCGETMGFAADAAKSRLVLNKIYDFITRPNAARYLMPRRIHMLLILQLPAAMIARKIVDGVRSHSKQQRQQILWALSGRARMLASRYLAVLMFAILLPLVAVMTLGMRDILRINQPGPPSPDFADKPLALFVLLTGLLCLISWLYMITLVTARFRIVGAPAGRMLMILSKAAAGRALAHKYYGKLSIRVIEVLGRAPAEPPSQDQQKGTD